MVGVPTTAGSAAIATHAASAASDASCLRHVRSEETRGLAQIIGRANMHEMALGSTGINPWYGTPVNPQNSLWVPGGSSSGSAVSVAVGDADIAFGTDTGGSIRIPAACCGVFGLKPTLGRVDTRGVLILAPNLDVVGPIARDTQMLSKGLELLTGSDVSFRGDVPDRIGRFRLPTDTGVAESIDRALGAAGFGLTDVALPGWNRAEAAYERVLMSSAIPRVTSWVRGRWDLVSDDITMRLSHARRISAAETAKARSYAGAWRRELLDVLRTVRVIALPTLTGPPPLLDSADLIRGLIATRPISLAGVPAVTIPVASSRAMPRVGLQLIALDNEESLLLAMAARIEASQLR